MLQETSPWLEELKRDRPATPLMEESHWDVAVVGGGISGIATAYFILAHTDLRLLLIEKERISSGATGHNGGQALADFEQSRFKLCEMFGEELVSDGLRAVEGAWDLLHSIISKTGIDVDVREIWAYIALSSIDDMMHLLEEHKLSEKLGVPKGEIFLAEETAGAIPEEYQSLFTIKRKEELREILHAKTDRYICTQKVRVGLMNSALFCEELTRWMLEKYPDRLSISEETCVTRINFPGRYRGRGKGAILETVWSGAGAKCGESEASRQQVGYTDAAFPKGIAHTEDSAHPKGIAHPEDSARPEDTVHMVYAEHVVLCTNGYDCLTIEGADSSIIARTRGVLGFMVGYLEGDEKEPMALAFYDSGFHDPDADYHYLSRRRYNSGQNRMLLCLGGQDRNLNEFERRHPELIEGIEEYYSRIEMFHKDTITDMASRDGRDFSWNGLMGYTSSGVRIIGPDPKNSSLIYNFCCNGIGILSSIYGGKKIAQILNGETLPPSIFDPDRKFL